MHHKHSCPLLLFLSSPSTKTELDKLEAEHLALTQTIANKNKLFNKVVDFLPNMEQRFAAMIDDLVQMTQPEVDKARGMLRELIGQQILLHPSSDGAERFLTAELSGDYEGLMKLVIGSNLLLHPTQGEKFYFGPKIMVPLRATQADPKRANAKK
jgi:hypothetical protein